MRRDIIAAVVIIALLTIGAATVWRTRMIQLRSTATVQRGTITATVEATGIVQPARQARLSLQTGGVVEEILVEVGDQVVQGDVLLRLDTTELERSVRQAELTLEMRRTALWNAEAGPDAAEVEIARVNVLQATMEYQAAQAAYDEIANRPGADSSGGAVALENARVAYQRAMAEFERVIGGVAPEQIERLQNEVTAAELALEEARAHLAQAELTAPFDGTVLQVDVQEDESVGPNQLLMVMGDLTRLEIVAQVGEIDVGEVRAGQFADVRLDAFPDQVLLGEIMQVSPAAATEGGASVFQTTVKLEGTDLPVKAGMGAKLEITTREKAGILVLPSRAIQTLGQQKVVKVRRGGQTHEVEVITGITNGELTEVVEGLQEGEVVVIERSPG
ncbi:MAG: efflux RND transporter periplasmic adaptor subunit [Anaerolineae bacterium]